MDYGERVYHQLYARGGLSDRLSSAVSGVRGLGDASPSGQIMFQLLPNEEGQILTQSSLARIVAATNRASVPEGMQPTQVPASFDCGCALSNIQGDDPALMQQLAAMCSDNPAGFAAAMAQQGISLECQPEWYMQPKTWMIAGGVVAAGVLLWAVL